MIIKLDHYRRSRTRDLIDSYYEPQVASNAVPERELATVLYATWRPAPQSSDNSEGIITPENG